MEEQKKAWIERGKNHFQKDQEQREKEWFQDVRKKWRIDIGLRRIFFTHTFYFYPFPVYNIICLYRMKRILYCIKKEKEKKSNERQLRYKIKERKKWRKFSPSDNSICENSSSWTPSFLLFFFPFKIFPFLLFFSLIQFFKLYYFSDFILSRLRLFVTLFSMFEGTTQWKEK